jgi:hypothetical protein
MSGGVYLFVKAPQHQLSVLIEYRFALGDDNYQERLEAVTADRRSKNCPEYCLSSDLSFS